MSTNSTTKQKIVDASISLFNSKGFDGISVREIAKAAKVNVSNISYYFNGKDGLLEYLVQIFFEEYLLIMEKSCKDVEHSAKKCLFDYVNQAMHFQMQNRHLTRFVYREITKDTTLIREIMTTYLAKEKFYLKNIIENGINQKQFQKVPVSFVIMQLKGLISMPFLQTQYISEVLHIMPYEDYFLEQYIGQIHYWVQKTICQNENDLTHRQSVLAAI